MLITLTEAMTNIPFATTDWRRDVGKEAQIPVFNRYFEEDPTVIDGGSALLARPAVRKWKAVGSGPIRGMGCQLGMFNDALFVVSDTTLWKIKPDETMTSIGSGLAGSPNNYVPMCFTDNYLFLADGTNLWVYTDSGFAVGTLTVTGTISANETVQINGIYYKFVAAGTVNTGTPAGTNANPWLVSLGASNTDALANLSSAIENTGVSGTDYSSVLTANTNIAVSIVSASLLKIRYTITGAGGNAVTTAETMANASWGGATLSGGGTSTFTTVTMPDNVGAVWCDTIAGFVVVVVAQGFNRNGRFYWIQPGESVIDPLDFATAERSPDPLYSVCTLGDAFWLFGASTTEIWYPTGDGDAPFQRIQGRLFDRGIWGGTAIKIGDEMIVTDRDGVVWRIGKGIERVSNNGVEQRIREAMALELRT
jgi:hypothetical protein